MPRTSLLCVCFAVVLAGSIAANGSSVPQYGVTDLGTLSGDSQGMAINAGGAVVGMSGSPLRAFVYSGGTMQDIGGLGGAMAGAAGISDNGLVAGFALNSSNSCRAFLYSGGVMQNLGTLAGGSSSMGTAVNSAGQVTGQAGTSGGTLHAFLYSGGVMQDLGTFGGLTSAGKGINASGQVTGGALNASGLDRAFVYSGGVMNDIGTLGGTWACGESINSSGQVTGQSGIAGGGILDAHAFLYSGGVMYDLGTLGGSSALGYGINDAGVVVGSSTLAGDAVEHAFIYTGSTIQDLNDLIDPASGWTLTDARCINVNGLITGVGVNSAGQTHAYLLTPLPEPASILLLGLAGLGIVRRRRG